MIKQEELKESLKESPKETSQISNEKCKKPSEKPSENHLLTTGDILNNDEFVDLKQQISFNYSPTIDSFTELSQVESRNSDHFIQIEKLRESSNISRNSFHNSIRNKLFRNKEYQPVGTPIKEGHVNYLLMFDMLTGIKISVLLQLKKGIPM